MTIVFKYKESNFNVAEFPIMIFHNVFVLFQDIHGYLLKYDIFAFVRPGMFTLAGFAG